MGQQQLLLLVLSAIIVGVSIVIGINMFASSATQANQDAVLQDCLNIAARAQVWYIQTVSMGGGGRAFDGGGGVTLAKLNIDASNDNGSYVLSNVAAQTLTIDGTGVEGSPLVVTVVAAPDSITSTTIAQ